jgi:hypothetical protein
MIPKTPILLHSVKSIVVQRPLGLPLFPNQRIRLLVNVKTVPAASCAVSLSAHRSRGRSQALPTTTKYRLCLRTRRYQIAPSTETRPRMEGTVLRESPLGGRHLLWGNGFSRGILMASIKVDQRVPGLYRILLSVRQPRVPYRHVQCD